MIYLLLICPPTWPAFLETLTSIRFHRNFFILFIMRLYQCLSLVLAVRLERQQVQHRRLQTQKILGGGIGAGLEEWADFRWIL